jgi:hypothetical protein
MVSLSFLLFPNQQSVLSSLWMKLDPVRLCYYFPNPFLAGIGFFFFSDLLEAPLSLLATPRVDPLLLPAAWRDLALLSWSLFVPVLVDCCCRCCCNRLLQYPSPYDMNISVLVGIRLVATAP